MNDAPTSFAKIRRVFKLHFNANQASDSDTGGFQKGVKYSQYRHSWVLHVNSLHKAIDHSIRVARGAVQQHACKPLQDGDPLDQMVELFTLLLTCVPGQG